MLRRVSTFILRQPAVALAWGMAILATLSLIAVRIYLGDIATDFSVYWRAANEPPSIVYDPRPGYPFPYAPTMLIWLAPLVWMPLWPAFFFWGAVSTILLFRTCRTHLTKNEALLVLASPPFILGLLAGQVSAALTALLLWAMGTGSRFAAGIALGVIASIKPQLILIAPLFLLFRHDWRALIGSACTFLVLAGLSVTLFGTDLWFRWVGAFDHFHEILIAGDIFRLAITPAGAAERWGLSSSPFMVIGALVGTLLVYRCRNSNTVAATAAVAGGSLLAAPYALVYDLVAVMPFLVWAIYRGSISAAVAISGTLNPLPLALTALNLLHDPVTGRIKWFDRLSIFAAESQLAANARTSQATSDRPLR